jgi:hypothetical protein
MLRFRARCRYSSRRLYFVEVNSNDAASNIPLLITKLSPQQPPELFKLFHALLAPLYLLIDRSREIIHFALFPTLVL